MKFSVIMPAYNCEKYIKSAIESVLNQTFKDFELIIVDDGSQDHTYDICTSFKENDNVHVFKKEHAGVSAARNFGIEKSLGDNILFIDCDDFWDEKLLKLCNSLVENDSNLILFGIQSVFFNKDNSIQRVQAEMDNSEEVLTILLNDNIPGFFSKYNMASPCNKIFKSEILKKNHILFNEKCVYLEDLKFNLDYLKYCDKIKVLKKDLYNYRLFVNQNQIFKRQFKGLFVNADELFFSFQSFAQNKKIELKEEKVFLGILTSAYFKEFLSHCHNKSKKEQIELLKKLYNNPNFDMLIKNSEGQFFKFFNIARILHISWIQLKLINWRF